MAAKRDSSGRFIKGGGGGGVGLRVVREVPGDWWHKPVRRMLEDWMLMVHTEVSQPGRVPIDTGNLRNSLAPGSGVTGVDPSSPSTWARVGTNVEYGGYLDASENHFYASGPSMGWPTLGWLSDLPDELDSQTQQIIDDTARALESAWGKGR